MIAELAALAEHFDVGFDDRLLSHSPAAHIADRVSTHASNMIRGLLIPASPIRGPSAAALPDAHPTFFFVCPAWQKIKAGIEANWPRRTGSKARWPTGHSVSAIRLPVSSSRARRAVGAAGRPAFLADKLVLSKVRRSVWTPSDLPLRVLPRSHRRYYGSTSASVSRS